MNNMPYPYMPVPYQFPQSQPQTMGVEEEIKRLKAEINRLKERVNALEKKENKNYLQKDDSLYMM